MTKTVMFVFGGRRANLELQLPFIHRILDEDKSIEYHLWNTARDPLDAQWMQTCRTHRRMHVHNLFQGQPTGQAWNAVYRYYATPAFKDCRFIKLDDDVVFIQALDVPHFIDAMDNNPHAVVSANTINNGACALTTPALHDQLKGIRVRWLDVHKSVDFARISHNWFLDNWDDVLGDSDAWVPTKEWLSINFIGYDYDMARRFAKLLGTTSPRVIAGRSFRGYDKLGDEGMVNTLPRIITKGFTVAHLTFGPQERKDPQLFDDLRKRYAEVNRKYLETR